MKPTRLLLGLFVLGLCLQVSESMAQTSDFKVEADPYQWENGVFKEWNNDMVRIGITTEERGLIFKITISNPQETEALTIENLYINVRVKYGDQTYSRVFKQININYVYLPPKGEYPIFVPVDFGYSDVIGSYKAELTHSIGTYNEQNIDPYPFEFRVVGSEVQLQKEIEQKRGGPVIIIGPFVIKLFDFSIGITVISVPIVLILIYFWRKRH